MSQRLLLSQALIDNTTLDEEALSEALRRQEESGRRLTDVLLEMEAVPEGELLGVLGGFYSIPVRENSRYLSVALAR